MAQFIKADLTEMVFEDRERRYGAYFLRKKYSLHLLIATTVALALLLVVVFAPQIAFASEGDEHDNIRDTGIIDLADLPPPPLTEDDLPLPPPPPKPPIPIQLQEIAFKIPDPKPVDEIEKEERIEENNMLDTVKAVISTKSVEGDPTDIFNTIPGEGSGPPAVIQDEDPKVDDFVFVSEEPKTLNMDDVRKLIGYPDIARDAGIEGMVVVRVLVDEQGNYRKHKMIKKIHPILADAVEKNLHKLKFTPAIQGSKPIKFWVNIPFRFELMR